MGILSRRSELEAIGHQVTEVDRGRAELERYRREARGVKRQGGRA